MGWSNLFSFVTGLLTQVSCDFESDVLHQEVRHHHDAQAPLPPTATASDAATPLKLTITPTLVTGDLIKEAVRTAMQAGQVQDILRGTRHRLIQVDNLHSWTGADKRDQNGFRATVADYTNGRTIYIDSADAFGSPSSLSVIETNEQPLPSSEEIADAAVIAGYGKDALAYATMPPVIQNTFSNGTSHRILHIMVRAADSTSDQMYQYYVNMNNRTAERVPGTPSTRAVPGWCNVLKTNAQLKSSGGDKRVPGAASVIISKGNEILWDLTVLRPAASGGKLGSGLDVRNVKYKGKKVLGQGHLPILNVQYKEDNPGCGPTYRDWQFEEYPFECEGTDIPGTDYLRICKMPPKTIVDTPGDPTKEEKGGFRGVAFYATDDSVLIRSYLTAGWYRYTTEWTFKADGTIKPRWGFGAVLDGSRDCVCTKHHHHGYFRFDFDIETPYGNTVQEFNDPRKADQTSNWHEILFAVQSDRTPGPNAAWKKQAWKISNQRTGNAYLMRPGPIDANSEGPSDKYGVDGVWVMKHDNSAIDDGGEKETGIRGDTKAAMDIIMNKSGGRDSAVSGKDVVVWYAIHFMHDEKWESEHPHSWKHLYGPDLVPEKWA